MQVGDDAAHTAAVIGGNMAKTKFATGEDSSEAKAPAAPQ
jgi:hypothetical protein